MTLPNSVDNRIQFVHALRGMACLMVIIDHMFISTKYFKIGACGVGLFFLVSGFVIPISCRNTTSSEYVIRRIFRIYPIAIATTLLIFLISKYGFNLWISSVEKYNLQITPFSMFAAMFQVWDILNADPIRPIFWTLVIEEKFYLLFFIIKRFSPDVKLAPVMTVFYALLVFFLTFAYLSDVPYAASLVLRNCMFISFMLMGTLFYFSYKGELEPRNFKIMSSLLALSSLLCLCISPDGKIFDMSSGVYMLEGFPSNSKWKTLTAYAASFGIFTAVFKYQDHPFIHKWSNNVYICFLANISYPLYVIHQNINTNFPKLIPSRIINGLMPFAIAVVISYLLHVAIELPNIKFARKLAGHLKRKKLVMNLNEV